MLGEVIVDDQRVAAALHELFAHGSAGEGREVLQRSRVRRRGDDDDGVLHRAVLLQDADGLRDLRLLLADGDVDADHVGVTLVDDRVERHGGLAGLAVTDDQLALTAADRDHGVDRLDTGLQRLVDVGALDHARSDALDRAALVGRDRALAVDRLAERVDDAADQRIADRDGGDLTGAADLVALFNCLVVTEDEDADGVLFQVEGQAEWCWCVGTRRVPTPSRC